MTQPKIETIRNLRRAKEILQRRGWCRRELNNIMGEVCMIGAIGGARGLNTRSLTTDQAAICCEEEVRELAQTIREFCPYIPQYLSGKGVVVRSNDADDSLNREKVLHFFDATIDRLEKILAK